MAQVRPSILSMPAALLYAAFLVVGCGSEDGGSATDSAVDSAPDAQHDGSGPDAQHDAQHDGFGGDAATAVDVKGVDEGTFAVFDLQANTDEPEGFFDLPFPLDARTTADGKQDWRAMPTAEAATLVPDLVAMASDKVGYATMTPAWFRFQAPLAPIEPPTDYDAAPGSPLWLVDIDAASPEYGRLFPTVAGVLPPDGYTPENLLAIAPRPGIVLVSGRTYAYVVWRDLNDASGDRLGVPAALASLMRGEAGGDPRADALQRDFDSLWTALKDLGRDRTDVATAAVFTVGDPVTELYELTEVMREKYDLQLENIGLDTDDGADHDRFCEIHATIRFPQFQVGTPPFNTDGLFEFDPATGLPIEQRTEVAQVVLTMPKNTPMPEAGYPLVMYFHGSGGLSTQAVDRGPIVQKGGAPVKGQGPSYVVAEHGFGSACFSMPVNPERLVGASDIAYINIANPKAMRDTFRQGVIESRLFFDALSDLVLPAESVAECGLNALPNGSAGYRFDTSTLYFMGNSMGGMYANMVGAVEPRAEALAPSGAGGYWTYFILDNPVVGSGGDLIGLLLFSTGVKLSILHPALAMASNVLETVDPIVFVPRLSRFPVQGHPVRQVYEPVGWDDSFFPYWIYDAIATAYGNQQAGPSHWPSLQQTLALEDFAGIADYAVSDNRTGGGDAHATGQTPYTGVVTQWLADEFIDSHSVFAQLDEVKYQFGCFFRTFRDTGVAVVPAPAALGTPCPGL